VIAFLLLLGITAKVVGSWFSFDRAAPSWTHVLSLISGRWNTSRDFFKDLAIAIGFMVAVVPPR
jgi:hypothetical protein